MTDRDPENPRRRRRKPSATDQLSRARDSLQSGRRAAEDPSIAARGDSMRLGDADDGGDGSLVRSMLRDMGPQSGGGRDSGRYDDGSYGDEPYGREPYDDDGYGPATAMARTATRRTRTPTPMIALMKTASTRMVLIRTASIATASIATAMIKTDMTATDTAAKRSRATRRTAGRWGRRDISAAVTRMTARMTTTTLRLLTRRRAGAAARGARSGVNRLPAALLAPTMREARAHGSYDEDDAYDDAYDRAGSAAGAAIGAAPLGSARPARAPYRDDPHDDPYDDDAPFDDDYGAPRHEDDYPAPGQEQRVPSDTPPPSGRPPAPFGTVVRMLAGRYLRARRKEGFISVIALLSLIGVTLSVAVLIVVMSVMNGFRAELVGKIIGTNGHMTAVANLGGPIENYDAVAERVRAVPGAWRAAPIISAPVFATGPFGGGGGVQVRGITLEDLQRMEDVAITPEVERRIACGVRSAPRRRCGLGPGGSAELAHRR